MSVCWKILILLGCTLWRASHSQSTWNHQRTVCVPAGSNVTVPCLRPKNGDEMTFTLHKDGEKIRSCSFDTRSKEFKCFLHPRLGVTHQHDNKSVSFILTGLSSGSEGVYICEVKVTFPPPMKDHNASRVMVIVEGDLFKCRKETSEPDTSTPDKHHWNWGYLGVIVALCGYSIVVTIISVIHCIKLRDLDFQNDYINTKPRAPVDRRNKSWIMNPPRYC